MRWGMQQAFLASALQGSNWLDPHPGRLTSGKKNSLYRLWGLPYLSFNTKARWAQKPVRTFWRRKMFYCLCWKSNHDSSAVQSVVTTWTDISRVKQGVKEGVWLSWLTTETRRQLSTLFPWRDNPLVGQGLLTIEGSRSHSDTVHSIALFRTSDQLVAETSTWQHTTLTRDRLPWPRRDSNPPSQQARSHSPTTQTARPLGSAVKNLWPISL